MGFDSRVESRRERSWVSLQVNIECRVLILVGTTLVVGGRVSYRTSPDQNRDRGGWHQSVDRTDTSLDVPLHTDRLGYSVRTVGGRVSSRTPPCETRGHKKRRQSFDDVKTSYVDLPRGEIRRPYPMVQVQGLVERVYRSYEGNPEGVQVNPVSWYGWILGNT